MPPAERAAKQRERANLRLDQTRGYVLAGSRAHKPKWSCQSQDQRRFRILVSEMPSNCIHVPTKCANAGTGSVVTSSQFLLERVQEIKAIGARWEPGSFVTKGFKYGTESRGDNEFPGSSPFGAAFQPARMKARPTVRARHGATGPYPYRGALTCLRQSPVVFGSRWRSPSMGALGQGARSGRRSLAWRAPAKARRAGG